MPRLTKRRVQAIANALNFYLAGEPNDGDELSADDYKAARDWADERLQQKTTKKPSTKSE